MKKRKRRLVKISEIFEKKKERSIHRKNCKSKKIILKENQNEDDEVIYRHRKRQITPETPTTADLIRQIVDSLKTSKNKYSRSLIIEKMQQVIYQD